MTSGTVALPSYGTIFYTTGVVVGENGEAMRSVSWACRIVRVQPTHVKLLMLHPHVPFARKKSGGELRGGELFFGSLSFLQGRQAARWVVLLFRCLFLICSFPFHWHRAAATYRGRQ